MFFVFYPFHDKYTFFLFFPPSIGHNEIGRFGRLEILGSGIEVVLQTLSAKLQRFPIVRPLVNLSPKVGVHLPPVIAIPFGGPGI